MTGISDLAVIVEGCVSIAVCAAATAGARAIRQHSRDHRETHDALERLDTRLERVEDEFYPNGGSSSRDLLDGLVDDVRRLAHEQGVTLPPRRSRPKGRKP